MPNAGPMPPRRLDDAALTKRSIGDRDRSRGHRQIDGEATDGREAFTRRETPRAHTGFHAGRYIGGGAATDLILFHHNFNIVLAQ